MPRLYRYDKKSGNFFPARDPPGESAQPDGRMINTVSKLVMVLMMAVYFAVVTVGIASLFIHGAPLDTLRVLFNFVFWPTLVIIFCYTAKAFGEKLLMTLLAQLFGKTGKLPGMPALPDMADPDNGEDDGA